MARKHKYKKGSPVEGLISAVAQINNGQWLYFRHKPLHPGWLCNWSIMQLKNAIKYRQLFYAIPTMEETNDGKQHASNN